jgi:hypothetical protein
VNENKGVLARQSIEEIVTTRDEAMKLYEEAFDAIDLADQAIGRASAVASSCHPGVNQYSSNSAREAAEFLAAVSMPDRETYLTVARRLLDADIWAYIIERTELETLMDKKAKDDLRKQMEYVPQRTRNGEVINGDEIAKGLPPVTVETVEATLRHFAGEADSIWRRGIATAFSNLDKRFKSHDGFKIGSRMILTYCFSEWGGLAYGGHHRDTLLDIERAFLVLDGKPPRAAYGGICGLVEANKQRPSSDCPAEWEGDYFRLVGYMNGNGHLWFTRKDLVQKVNQILAEHYGEVIGEGNHDDQGPDPLENRKMTVARSFGFFPTSEEVADQIFEHVPLYAEQGAKTPRYLEPSAGTGILSSRMVGPFEHSEGWGEDRETWEVTPFVDVCEIQRDLATALEETQLYRRVICRDFLTVDPEVYEPYDLVVMNPPFDLERDIDHVTHALKFLRPGGTLISIMSAGTEFRETRKAVAFRKLMKKWKAQWRDLPAGSFAHAGTWVNTRWVKVRTPEA